MSVPVIRIVNVKGIPAADRPGICYVGRKCAGWPFTRYGNPFRVKRQDSVLPGSRHLRTNSVAEAVEKFRAWFTGRPDFEELLAYLWEACDNGAKPLGCWCCNWDGLSNPAPHCHAVVLSQLLQQRYLSGAQSNDDASD